MNDLKFDLIIDPSRWPDPEQTEEVTESPAATFQPVNPTTFSPSNKPAKARTGGVEPFVWIIVAVAAAAAVAAALLVVLTKKNKKK